MEKCIAFLRYVYYANKVVESTTLEDELRGWTGYLDNSLKNMKNTSYMEGKIFALESHATLYTSWVYIIAYI